MVRFNVFAVAAVLLFSSVSAKLIKASRSAAAAQAQAQAASMVGGGGGYGGGYANSMANSMANGYAGGYGGGYGGGYAQSQAQAQAQAMSGSMGGMGMSMASASASASVSMGAIQTRWNNAQGFCNDAMSRVANFIAKIEESILGLPLQIIKAMMGIPIKVIEQAINTAHSMVPLLFRAKMVLSEFFQTVFELPAKAIYGSISIFLDLINKILDWGQTCHGQPVCPSPPPNIGGYGPCGGRWPCTRVVACQSTSCFATARALESPEANLEL